MLGLRRRVATFGDRLREFDHDLSPHHEVDTTDAEIGLNGSSVGGRCKKKSETRNEGE